jgi:O-methyltransferase
MDNIFVAKMLRNWDHRSPWPWQRPINKALALARIDTQLEQRAFTWGMSNIETRMNLFHLVSQCAALNVPGEFVEVGCNSGESSVVIQKVLQTLAPDRQLYCYDSFEGLPEIGGVDSKTAVYAKGAMSASLQSFHNNFKTAGVPVPANVFKGWFEETVPANLPEKVAFAFLDVDLYASTKHVLAHVYSRLSPGGICMFGVYYDEKRYSQPATIKEYKSPGVQRAADEFFRDKPEKVSVLYANEYSNGYFRKV